MSSERPPAESTATVEALGRLSEAYECLIRARGQLYAVHQLIGRVDLLTGEAADLLERAGHPEQAARLRTHLVGRNVLDGRWTFQVVEEFDDAYFRPYEQTERDLRAQLQEGRRHVHESEMKDERRTPGLPGHERRPDDGSATRAPGSG